MSANGNARQAGAAGEPRLLLKHGNVLDYFPAPPADEPRARVEDIDLRVRGDRIIERGRDLPAQEGEEVLDLHSVSVLPGNVNGHTHLYSTFAAGMPRPQQRPQTFTDILTQIWWPLDRALDAESIYLSAIAGAWDAVRCGTTLLFDHHSSLTSVRDSLDHVEEGVRAVGLRACLCYETTDRGGKGSRDTTLVENERYVKKLREQPAGGVPFFRALIGGHASFTLEERTLGLLGDLCAKYDIGAHLHLAEGTTDREVSQDRGWKDPLERLLDFGLVRRGSIFAHGVDLTPLDMQTLEEHGCWLVHCGRSNMNNGVGRAPVDRFPDKGALGTDGLDDNMWGELRTTFFRGNEGGRGPLGYSGAERFWFGSYRLAREVFGEPFGTLDAGAPADFIILNTFQKTPLTEDTWLSHLLYNFHPWDIESVYVGGRRVYHTGDRAPVDAHRCREKARQIWSTMGWER